MVLIENDGALFRGPARGVPVDVWLNGKWHPYKLAGQPKPVEWGRLIDDVEAEELAGQPVSADDGSKG